MDGEVRLCVFFILFCVVMSAPKMIPMKIVDEPSTYGFNFNSNNNFNGPDDNSLKMRVDPSAFSGPPHLKRLQNKCFNLTDENYKYEFCPFSNVTQHEQSLRWNPYSGVLGVWQQWEIVNDSFVAMWMRNGDDCGMTKRREVKVILKCGKKEEIKKVSEPNTCSYEMIFKTPLVCHNHSLLVYPTLNESLRHEWDVAYTDYHYGYLTLQGYNKKMKKIFQKAGFYITEKKEPKQVDPKENVESHAEDFLLLPTCNEEYKILKEQNQHLINALKELQKRMNASSIEELLLATNETIKT